VNISDTMTETMTSIEKDEHHALKITGNMI